MPQSKAPGIKERDSEHGGWLEKEGAEASIYAFGDPSHQKNCAGSWGDAIGRVPLYTKASRCQVIAPILFGDCLAPQNAVGAGFWGGGKACEI